ncbi:hypothetical protein TI39_contig4208g00015 [Zymoseptoria brevis]|uniref:RNase H type-1 domain-containing protein n=1 Tax=Zymoseptoria brevis TaxID=1047168 RepID=A0A0F4GA13_9PEZI|nr:hypothetical protein TI39_contig4208g00015 [Zymoseptoria brevis]
MLLGRAFIGRSFSYLTFITYWSLAFYFSVSAWHTFTYAFNLCRGRTECISHLHDSLPRSLQLAHAIWHTTITTLPFLVTLVFWSTMYARPETPSAAFVIWINVSVHGLNSLFAMVGIIFSATKPPPFFSHLLIVKIILALYLGLAYVTRFTQGFYPYPWMITLFGWQGIVAHVFAYGGDGRRKDDTWLGFLVCRFFKGSLAVGQVTEGGGYLPPDAALARYDKLDTEPAIDLSVYSDSRYAVDCMSDWIYKWSKNGWINAAGNPVANQDLIKEASGLDDRAAALGKVVYKWIPREQNAAADAACNRVLDEQEDDGYSSSYSSSY